MTFALDQLDEDVFAPGPQFDISRVLNGFIDIKIDKISIAFHLQATFQRLVQLAPHIRSLAARCIPSGLKKVHLCHESVVASWV